LGHGATSAWTKVGEYIDGEASGDKWLVHCHADVGQVAIGTYINNGYAGHVYDLMT
jgi:hypothetical protein